MRIEEYWVVVPFSHKEYTDLVADQLRKDGWAITIMPASPQMVSLRIEHEDKED